MPIRRPIHPNLEIQDLLKKKPHLSEDTSLAWNCSREPITVGYQQYQCETKQTGEKFGFHPLNVSLFFGGDSLSHMHTGLCMVHLW